VLVEASPRSSILHAARDAHHLGRVVMGVPGPVTSALSRPVHHLIRDRQAVLITTATDVLAQLGPTSGEHHAEQAEKAGGTSGERTGRAAKTGGRHG